MTVFYDCQRKQLSIFTRKHLGPDIAWVEDLVCVIKFKFFFFFLIFFLLTSHIYLFTDLFNCFANAVLFFFLHL